jgi:hypothetical protein
LRKSRRGLSKTVVSTTNSSSWTSTCPELMGSQHVAESKI